jgi:hypothetical protein
MRESVKPVRCPQDSTQARFGQDPLTPASGRRTSGSAVHELRQSCKLLKRRAREAIAEPGMPHPETATFESTRPTESGDPPHNSTGHSNPGSALGWAVRAVEIHSARRVLHVSKRTAKVSPRRRCKFSTAYLKQRLRFVDCATADRPAESACLGHATLPNWQPSATRGLETSC